MSVGAPLVPSYLRGAAEVERATPRRAQMRLFPDQPESPAADGPGRNPTRREGAGLEGPNRTSTLSYTSLTELERCGYRYYLERELGMREDRAGARSGSGGGGLEARARGTIVHGLLETLDFRSPGAPTPDAVGAYARELGTRTSGQEREEIAGLIGGALAAAPAARLAGAVRVRREYPFAFTLATGGAGQALISGVIDLLADEPDGGRLLIDYKSDRVGREEDLGALVAREYGIQRLIYALAVLRDGEPRVEIVHWFLERPEEPVSAAFAAADRSQLEDQLAARIHSARARGFAVSEHPHRGLCETCPGRGGLCSWSDAETLRETAVA